MDDISDVPQDVEDEANYCFQRLYNLVPQNPLPMEEAFEMLKKYQLSPIKRERVIILLYI